MSSMAVHQRLGDQPWQIPNGNPATWIHLEDIPTPPEVTKIAEEDCKAHRFHRKHQKAEILQEWKLLFFFPGKEIAFKPTARGMLLLLVTDPFAPEMQTFRDALPEEERWEVQTMFIPGENDGVASI